MKTETQYAIRTCPLPTGPAPVAPCGQDVHIFWEGSAPLYSTILTDGTPVELNEDVAWCLTWRIECEAGHVLVVPVDMSIDPDAPDTDADEAHRTLRVSELARIVATLGALRSHPSDTAGDTK